MHFKATAENTGGKLSLMERTVPPSIRMTPPHTHPGAEVFFVLDGEITFILDGNQRIEGRGVCIVVPGGTPHTFGNTSSGPARLLIIHTPALDAYFAELEQLWSGATAPTVEEERALMSRHGMKPA
jgi:quercetin dioxygenase-like cupin family protein